MKMEPAGMRSNVEETGSGLRITIPSRGKWFEVLFLCAWLCGWAFGEAAAIGFLFGNFAKASAKGVPPVLFVAAWLTAWTMGGAFVLYTVIWSIAGREIISLDGTSLSIAHAPIPVPPTREFEWGLVRDLRVSPVTPPRSSLWSHSREGTVTFDYGASTFRFGIQLDEAEGKMLLEAMQRRFPLAGAR